MHNVWESATPTRRIDIWIPEEREKNGIYTDTVEFAQERLFNCTITRLPGSEQHRAHLARAMRNAPDNDGMYFSIHPVA